METGRTEENLADAPCPTEFARRVKEAILAGKRFRETFGYLPESLNMNQEN